MTTPQKSSNAERHGGAEAHWQHYITCRREIVDGVKAASSKLGSDPTKWTPPTPVGRITRLRSKAVSS